MLLIDSHCHLDYPDFTEDFPEVLARAARADVGGILTIGTHLSRAAPVIALAEAHARVWATVGVHPHNAAEEAPFTSVAALEALAAHPRVVGLGETGLDYFYDKSPRPAQQASFRQHIQASYRTGLPLVIHTRDAEDDTLALLQEEAAGRPVNGLLHCFSGSARLAEAGLELGLDLSFSGIITFGRKTEALKAVAAQVPLDRLLIETDAPFLAPVPRRGKRNEPAYVRHTAELLAELKGVSLETLAAATTANFARRFPKTGLPTA